MIGIKAEILKRFFSITMAFIFILSCQVFASSNEYVTTNPLNLRSTPSTDGSIITLLPVGTKVIEKQRLADGWSEVTVTINGVTRTGYVSNQYIAPSSSPLAAQAIEVGTGSKPSNIMYTTSNVNFRKAPSLDAEIYETVPTGTRITITQTLPEEWAAVIYNGVSGYMSTQYIASEPPRREMYTSANVNFRSSRTTDTTANIIALLEEGTIVTEIERYEDGWSRCEYKGLEAFIFNEHLLTPYAYSENKKNIKPVSSSSGSGSAASEQTRSSVNTKIAEISPSGVELVDWGTMKGLFSIGKDALVTDVWTGHQYYVRSFSNGNHADVETVSPNDTATMLATFGGSWTWDTRPVWVTINGRTFAASINGMPHGGGVNGTNNMNGQVCIHFRGSRTHNGNKSHENDHQASVTQAWNAANR